MMTKQTLIQSNVTPLERKRVLTTQALVQRTLAEVKRAHKLRNEGPSLASLVQAESWAACVRGDRTASDRLAVTVEILELGCPLSWYDKGYRVDNAAR